MKLNISQCSLNVNNSVAFGTLAMLCNHHFYLVSKHFYHYGNSLYYLHNFSVKLKLFKNENYSKKCVQKRRIVAFINTVKSLRKQITINSNTSKNRNLLEQGLETCQYTVNSDKFTKQLKHCDSHFQALVLCLICRLSLF